MIPEIITVSHTVVDWPMLKKNVSAALGQSPFRASDQCPVPLSEAAELLICVAIMKHSFTGDALSILRSMPLDCMEYLHYTFLIACDEKAYVALLNLSNITFTTQRVNDNVYCILGTGPLSAWFLYTTLTLSSKFLENTNYRVLFDKLLILLEQEGLGELFNDYKKISLQDKTFKLEHKK